MVKYKEHLTLAGITSIVCIKASINLGLPGNLNRTFPDIKPSVRPVAPSIKRIDPNWLAGFVSAEGNFFINIINSNNIVGKQVILMFSISQHSRDAGLLRTICNFLGCGKYYSRTNQDEGYITVTKFSEIDLKIIPLFKQYPIIGVKYLDFSEFSKVMDIIKVKEHLIKEGLAKIEKIKSGMNTKRVP